MSAPEYARRSETVRRAHQVIEAAWTTGRPFDLASQAAFALESAQLLQSPETAAEHERLRKRAAELEVAWRSARAEMAARPAEAHVLRQAAAALEEDDHLAAAAELLEIANQREHAASQRRWKADAAPELTVYQTSHNTIPFGCLYTTATAAHARCEAELRRELGDVIGDYLAWLPDHSGPDGVEALSVPGSSDEDPDQGLTGYVVTALTVKAGES